jgi:hypothetical protein
MTSSTPPFLNCGTSLSAKARYAAGTREILACWFEQRAIREENLIADAGRLAGAGAHSYTVRSGDSFWWGPLSP